MSCKQRVGESREKSKQERNADITLCALCVYNGLFLSPEALACAHCPLPSKVPNSKEQSACPGPPDSSFQRCSTPTAEATVSVGLSWFLVPAQTSGARSRILCHDGPQGHLLTSSEPHVHSDVNTVSLMLGMGQKTGGHFSDKGICYNKCERVDSELDFFT